MNKNNSIKANIDNDMNKNNINNAYIDNDKNNINSNKAYIDNDMNKNNNTYFKIIIIASYVYLIFTITHWAIPGHFLSFQYS